MVDEKTLRLQIYELIRQIYRLRKERQSFRPGRDKVQYAGAIIDENEAINVVNAILDGWLSSGKYTLSFEYKLAKKLGARQALLTNSGSSANLLAIASLTAESTPKELKLKPGDEVITPAATFPTTLNPIIQRGLIPVLVDVDLGTYNVNIEEVEKAISERTRAVFIPHTLGNPNDMDAIMDIAERYNLIVIEDSCDALGSKYEGKYVGTFGLFGTFSFYPAHQITTGEGGALVTNNEEMAAVARSLRDWGRACVFPVCNPLSCPDKSCPKSIHYDPSYRGEKLRELPEDYDKRYTYINIGYNLKATELQAAIGLAQLEKLDKFCEIRKRNFRVLYEEISKYEDYFIMPEKIKKADPCWFAFPLTIRDNAPFKRKDIIRWFVKHNIEIKPLFAGNIIKQPAYSNIKYRTVSSLKNSNYIMHNTFFIGVYPGIDEEKLNYIIETMKKFISYTTSR